VKASELGEFALIDRFQDILGPGTAPELIIGIGDDCAVWRAGDTFLLATTDTLVEGVHFSPGAPWCDVGWKALAVNVSDIAAMGGEPLFALVTLALNPDLPIDAAGQLYVGLREAAREYEVTIAGGDVVRAPQVSITVALTGRAQTSHGLPLLLRRDGGRAGDVIAVTGTLGDSAGGLLLLKQHRRGDLARAHLRPHPRLALAQEAARLGIQCGIDVSDGLLQDIGHICRRSRLGATVHADALPISDALREAFPDDALTLACTGGEDYELALAGPRHVLERLQAASGTTVTFIGELRDGSRVRLAGADGRDIEMSAAGWDHLRATGSRR
jgi:thiamine-monophosphate kinase